MRAQRASLDSTPIVCVRIDDGYASWLTRDAAFGGKTALDFCRDKRIPITWAIVPSFSLGAHPGSNVTLSQASYLGLAAYGADYVAPATEGTAWGARIPLGVIYDYCRATGGEIAAHSMNHSDSAGETTGGSGVENDVAYYIKELVVAKALLESVLPITVKTWIQPGAWNGEANTVSNMNSFAAQDSAVGSVIPRLYRQAMGYLNYAAIIGSPPARYGVKYDYGMDVGTAATRATALARLDEVARTPGMIYIPYGHGMNTARTAPTPDYTIDVDWFARYISRLAELRDAGRIRLMSVADAFDRRAPSRLNHLVNGDFESGSLWPWTSGIVNDSPAVSILSGGRSGKCAVVSGATSLYEANTNIVVRAGMYELSWYQQLASSGTGSCTMTIYEGAKLLLRQTFTNTVPTAWERKSVFLRVKDRTPIDPRWSGNGETFALDDLKLVKL